MNKIVFALLISLSLSLFACGKANKIINVETYETLKETSGKVSKEESTAMEKRALDEYNSAAESIAKEDIETKVVNGITLEKIHKKDMYDGGVFLEITYYQLSCKDKPNIQKLLDIVNPRLEKEARRYYDDMETDDQRQSFKEMNKEYRNPNTYEAYIDIETNNDKYLSIKVTNMVFNCGAAHPSSYMTSHNFDVKTGKELHINDVVDSTDNMKVTLTNWVKKTYANDEMFLKSGLEQIDLYFNDLSKVNFSIKNGKVYLLTSDYEFGSYADGRQELYICDVK